MDDNDTAVDGHLMDGVMDFGEEVGRQRRQRLRSMAVGAEE